MIGGGSIAGDAIAGSYGGGSANEGYTRTGDVYAVAGVRADVSHVYSREGTVNGVGKPLCDLWLPNPPGGIRIAAAIACRSNMPVNATDTVVGFAALPRGAYVFTVSDGRYLHATPVRTLNRTTITRRLTRAEV